MFRFESRKCPVCQNDTKLIVEVRRGETDSIPDYGTGRTHVCYKADKRGICYVHTSANM